MDTTLRALAARSHPMSRTDEVYVALRNELLLGRLGYRRLAEEALAERFCTSRTPVREALRRLEGDGHVERHPEGGLVPSPPRVDRMREFYEVRVVLEELVARRLGREPAHAYLEDLMRTWQTMRVPADLPSFVYADEAFHIGLAEASGHTFAADLLGDVNDRIRVLRVHDFMTADRVEATIREHVGILSALLKRDSDTAIRLLRENIEHSAAVVERRVGEALERMFRIDAGGSK